MAQKRKHLGIYGPTLWYFVGLVTSDGCLSNDGRHIDITSKERGFLEVVRTALGLTNIIGVKRNGIGQHSYRIQIGSRNLYKFLLTTGLGPNKSLTIKAIQVPDDFFVDFLRGVIDGDGCIRRWIHPSNRREQWSLRIYSGSENFTLWISQAIENVLRVKGRVYRETGTKWIAKYGKMAARQIAQRCYYENCLGLERKIALARQCINSHGGWQHSKTVLN